MRTLPRLVSQLPVGVYLLIVGALFAVSTFVPLYFLIERSDRDLQQVEQEKAAMVAIGKVLDTLYVPASNASAPSLPTVPNIEQFPSAQYLLASMRANIGGGYTPMRFQEDTQRLALHIAEDAGLNRDADRHTATLIKLIFEILPALWYSHRFETEYDAARSVAEIRRQLERLKNAAQFDSRSTNLMVELNQLTSANQTESSDMLIGLQMRKVSLAGEGVIAQRLDARADAVTQALRLSIGMLLVGAVASLIIAMMVWRLSKARDKALLAIQKTSDELQIHKQELLHTNDELEKRVLERTSLLDKARLEAERASRAKSAFLSAMSHELRTPLNAILGFAQVLELETDISAENQDSIREIRNAGNMLLDLINEVLDLTKIESGDIDLQLRPVALHSVINESCQLLRPRTRELNLTLEDVTEAAVEFTLLADRSRTRQILLNFISNAIKYNRPNGWIKVDAKLDGGFVRISVADSGLGIAPEKQDRVFNPFDRLGAENGKIEGTGIGLVICKRFAEAMGGQIGFHSVHGEGSTFWAALPVADVGDTSALLH